MKTPLFVLIGFLGVSQAGMAQAAHEAKPSATTTSGTVLAICRVSFDGSGQIKTAAMVKSTGSKVLDGGILQNTGQYAPGPRNLSINFPVPVKSIEAPTPHGNTVVRVATPKAPYPFQARARHEQGSGIVKASFDEAGNAVSAVMVQSTGSKILDGNTVNYALKRWKSSGEAKITTTIPVTYRLQ